MPHAMLHSVVISTIIYATSRSYLHLMLNHMWELSTAHAMLRLELHAMLCRSYLYHMLRLKVMHATG